MKRGIRYGRWTSGWGTSVAMVSVMAGLTACDPVPRRVLSTDEKIADLYWVYSQFGEQYAPLDYKQKRLNFDYATFKNRYVEEAKKTATNEEFYALLLKFASEFKDAHTAISLTNSFLPDRAKVAFLGFSGQRQGDGLIVKTVLPTNDPKSTYPIKVGDEIVSLNGKKLKDIVDAELIQYRDLGFSESNYTFHFNKIFTRVSTANGLPKETEARVEFNRGGKKYYAVMPWVVKDMVQFQQEQTTAKKESGTQQDGDSPLEEQARIERENQGGFLMVSDDLKKTLNQFLFYGFDGRVEMPYNNLLKVTQGLKRKITDSFKFLDSFAEWEITSSNKQSPKEPLDQLADRRKVLEDAIYIAGSKTYPAYVAPITMLDQEGKATDEKKLVGYVYIDTFSPGDTTENVVKEFKNTLAAFKNLGVRDIIIDTINNGGGSLELGMRLAQALTPNEITQPLMQFRLSDSWLDEFQSTALNTPDEATKEYARRIYTEMLTARSSGSRLSKAYSAEVLYRYQIGQNDDLKQPFRVKLLINEMCASMCDIFAGLIQDNGLGQVIGTRSMGAGGNVVNHTQAPNSHADLRQTESLVLRVAKPGMTADVDLDGVAYQYVENNGVVPDLVTDVAKTTQEKYGPVLDLAVQVLATPASAPKTDEKKAAMLLTTSASVL